MNKQAIQCAGTSDLIKKNEGGKGVEVTWGLIWSLVRENLSEELYEVC